jgi:cytosine/adenosine deaminase-related metal-dependent hydrolase
MRSISFVALMGAFAFVSCSTPAPRDGSYANDLGDRAPAGENAEWVLSGYLPENPNAKVYVRVSGDRIVSVGAAKPPVPASVPVIESEGLIFPGLMDLHGHIKYNVLPLWKDAQGQFLNRYEWRAWSAYKDAVSPNMKPIKGVLTCAAVRWAELKALTGGGTAIQGIGNDGQCAKDFGTRTVDLDDDMAPGRKIRNMVDVVVPGFVGSVYVQYKIADRVKAGKTYDQAFEAFLREERFPSGLTVREWFDKAKDPNRDLALGLELLVGESFGIAAGDNSPSSFEKIVPQLTQHLAAKYELKDAKKQQDQLAVMRTFLFGKADTKGFAETTGVFDDKKAANFLKMGGVLTIPSPVRRYVGMWEYPTRRSLLEFFKEKPKKPVVIMHLAEGRQNDVYNRSEWRLLKEFGLAQPGVALIHGVGMSPQEIEEAGRMGVSFIWSPFSNLLLYGETLRVEEALKPGSGGQPRALVALGSDWTPTGSKHILDEARLAREYLRRKNIQVSDRQIVEMMTVNPAKILQVDDRFGRVAPGFAGDLTIVARKAGKDPYATLLETQQEDVQLVSVRGQPLYGDSRFIDEVARGLGDARDPDVAPSDPSCPFKEQKAFRFPFSSAYDRKVGVPPMQTLPQIRGLLSSAMLVPLDPLFSCEDASYAQRYGAFFDEELPRTTNATQRTQRRAKDRLKPDFSPLKVSPEEITQDGEEEGM